MLKSEQIAILMNGIDLRKQKILERKSDTEKEIESLGTPAEVVNSGIQKVFKVVSKKINGASFETKRAVLKLLVEKISLEKQKATVKVKIYADVNRVNGTVYQQFTLAYYDGAKRIKKRFADLAEAKREADLAVAKLANGEGQVLRLTSTDRAHYIQALDTLRPTGRQLNIAVAEYVDAISTLPPGVSLKEAVNDYTRRNNTVRESRTVPELVVVTVLVPCATFAPPPPPVELM